MIRANNFLFFVRGLFFLFFFFFFLSWLNKIIFPILMPTFILRFIVHTPNMGPMQIDLHYQKNTYYYIQKTNNSSWCGHKSMCFYYYGTYICKQSHIWKFFFEGSQSVWPNFKPLYSRMYDLFLNEYYQCFGINSWMKSKLLTKEEVTNNRKSNKIGK